MPPKLLYLVTEDWYFLSHRLPMARAAAAAGFEVHVATRATEGRARIEAEGFQLHALDWGRKDLDPRRLVGPVQDVRALLRRLAPRVLHNVALKPTLIGSLAATGIKGLGVACSINGLGSAYLATGPGGVLKRGVLKAAMPLLLNRACSVSIVQNPEDRAMLRALGVAETRLRLVPGSGVDTTMLQPLPEPAGATTIAYVGRMLADKGLHTLMAAHRLLRSRGLDVRLLLAGTPDPENPTSISETELAGWASEPGVEYLGHVTGVAKVWARAHIAVLPSKREGLPLSLLEAAACGRPMIATDVPGCREVVRAGENGILVPLDDAPRLADAIAGLATNPGLRSRMGVAARRRAEREFSVEVVTEQVTSIYRALAET
jgi:glycosyltransferase involved in cell wall biosynthesis